MYPELATQLKPVLQSSLRGYASDAGWPSEAISALSIEMVNEDLEVHIADNMSDQVNALEYGTADTPPAPAIRKFNAALPSLISPYLPNLIRKAAMELL